MKVILSCDENPIYSEFWPIVSWAYKKMGFECHLAYVTKDAEKVKKAQEFGAVTQFYPIDDVPTGNQAKMARFILASQFANDVCYIDDIDLFPLSKQFIIDKISRRVSFVLLCVGGEVYHSHLLRNQ